MVSKGFAWKAALKPVRRFLKAVLYTTYLVAAVWALLEIAYRYQWIDFYKTELQYLNPAASLKATASKPRILLFGDSFSAKAGGYVDLLRDSLPEFDIINAAVPGTGIREVEVIAADKLRRFPPDVLICQIYVGNDLWDIRKTYNSPEISIVRNAYWFLSDYSLFLRYLNYRSGQLKAGTGLASETRELKRDIRFAPGLYSRRELMLFRAEPRLVHQSIRAEGTRGEDLVAWLDKMDRIIANLPERTKRVVLVIIPHCAQVNDFYKGNLESLRVEPFGPEFRQVGFPFLNRIRQHYTGSPHVRIFSPLPDFQQIDSSGYRLFYENDPHLSGVGHRVLGAALFRFLAL